MRQNKAFLEWERVRKYAQEKYALKLLLDKVNVNAGTAYDSWFSPSVVERNDEIYWFSLLVIVN